MGASNDNIEDLNNLSDALARAAEIAGRSTVLVDARQRMPASGIAYTSELVLTADHVIEREEEIRVLLPNGQPVPASIAGRNPIRDIALLRLSQAVATQAVSADQPARIGQIALALGRPEPSGIQASLGVISAMGGPVRLGHGGLLEQYIRTDTIPFPGFSGGPLINIRGQILGLNTSGLSMGTLLTIPVSIAWQAAASLAAYGHIRRGYLGIRSQAVNLSPAQVESLNRDQKTGLLIVNVEDGSPAAMAGLVTGDLLVGISSKQVRDHEELQIHLEGDSIGRTLPVDILRGTTLTTFMVVIGEHAE